MELDNTRVQPLHGLEQNHVPIFPVKSNFQLTVNGKEAINVNRCHFPIVPRFSCTSHKSQGQTLKKAIVDLVKPPSLKNVDISFAYVPLSRIRRLEDLTILRPFNSEEIMNLRPNAGCKEMLDHFKERDLAKDL